MFSWDHYAIKKDFFGKIWEKVIKYITLHKNFGV